MKKFKNCILFIFLFISSLSFADELQVPFPCYPQELKQCFHNNGFEIELSADIRNPETWGFIKNEGNQFIVYTYNPITTEELEKFQTIIFDFYRKKGI